MIESVTDRLGVLARVPTVPSPVRSAQRSSPDVWPASLQRAGHRTDPGRVVHFVGRPTAAVFDRLGPTTQAIARAGTEQCVVLIDDPRMRHLLSRLDAGVNLVTVPGDAGLINCWVAARRALRRALAERPTLALRLHGGLAWVLRIGIALPGAQASGWTDPALGDVEAGALAVGSVFLDTPANPARRPLIVTSSRVDHPRSALAFAQLAVLLGDESLGMSFNWIGAVAAESQAALKAAHVGVFNVSTDRERAQRLSSGWVYLAVGDASGDPLFLLEAMALGLPCIAMDTAAHRNVVRHRETGLLCKNSSEVRLALAELVDSAELRQRIGSAARLALQPAESGRAP